LKPLVGAGQSTQEQSANGPEPPPEQELARVYTDLGVYLETKRIYAQSVQSHQQAIQIVNALRQSDPSNYEYKMEAANYYYNLACSFADEHELEQPKKAGNTASQLFDELAAPNQTLEQLRENNNTLGNWIDKKNQQSVKPTTEK
jgi:mevalonate kinase